MRISDWSSDVCSSDLKPIARQQVLQQNLALASEHVVAARMACETAVRHSSWPSPLAAASAKLIASRAAPVVAGIAHGLHGAIGISGEHDLNLLIRRIHASRLEIGRASCRERVCQYG